MAKSRNKPRREKRSPGVKRSPGQPAEPHVLQRTVHAHGTAELLAEYDSIATSFGVARRCRYRFIYPDGRVWNGWTWDPTWQPESIPDGAVRGDIRRQNNGAFGEPRYWYVDRPRRCVQCSVDFVFAAAEQKHWYETLGFYADSVAVRCPPCRKKRRTEASLRTSLAEALRATEQHPDRAAAWLDLAWATERLFRRAGVSNLDRGIHAARTARDRGEGIDADLVEAALQRLAGRPNKAEDVLNAALERPLTKRERAKLRASSTSR